MVHYLAATGHGIERYAETDCDFLDASMQSYWRHIEYADPSQVDARGLRENANRREQGYRLKPETLPDKMLWANGERPLPDILPGFIVSGRFRDVVEQFEPGLHQFVPIDIYRQRLGDVVTTYWWFIVGRRLDSVDRQHTTYAWDGGDPASGTGYWVDSEMDTTTWEFRPIAGARLVFSSERTSGSHIWHDPHLLTFGNGLCSDAFAEAATAAAFTGLAVVPRETV